MIFYHFDKHGKFQGSTWDSHSMGALLALVICLILLFPAYPYFYLVGLKDPTLPLLWKLVLHLLAFFWIVTLISLIQGFTMEEPINPNW